MKMERRPRVDSVEQFLQQQQKNNNNGGAQRKKSSQQRTEEMATKTAGENGADTAAGEYLVSLPLLRDAASSPAFQSALLLKKLRQCQAVLTFDDPFKQQTEKEVKTDALREVIEFMTTGKQLSAVLADQQMGAELFRVVQSNLFRPLPPSGCSSSHSGALLDAEDLLMGCESSVCLEPAWSHLQLVYRLLRLLIDRADTNLLNPFITDSFCSQLLELFHSEDPREREQAKMSAHALYARMGDRRAEIRRQMGNLLLEHTFENGPFNGVDELLQIIGDIVNGFNVPLKQEHRQFLFRVLLPLHKSNRLALFFNRLANCVTLFIEKEPELANTVVRALLRNWPHKSSTKEVLFITEIEEILARIGASEFGAVVDPLFRRLAKCANSQNSRVAESALSLWNNRKVLALILTQSQRALSEMLPALYWAGGNHWSGNVKALAFKTLNALMRLNDGKLLEELVKGERREEEGEEEGEKRRRRNGTGKLLLMGQQLMVI